MSDIEQQVNEATEKGKFNIVDAIRGRAYPKDEIFVYLDEESTYLASKIDDELKTLDPLTEEYKKLSEQQSELIEKINSNKYVFFIRGISEGDRDKVFAKATESYPIEYSENKNSFTGELVKTEIQNAERDRYFTNLLWVASIEKITAPDGSVQNGLTIEDVVEMRDSLPLAAIGAINESIEKVRLSTALFMLKVNQDFLAKS